MNQKTRHLAYRDVKITDSLFGEYAKRVYEKIIPHQWNILNDKLADAQPTYCIQNFRIAAGELQGERKGVVFQDTDLYKWLESVAYCLAGGHGKEYEPIADEVIALIEKAQEEDGYLNTYFTVNAPEKKWTNLIEGHELYTSGHMIEAAVAYYEATGKERFLKIAIKNADLICNVFGVESEKINGYPGHQEIELALVKLYRVTRDRKYLEKARYFIEERGKEPNYFTKELQQHGEYEFFPEFKNYDLSYSQAHMRPVNQRTAEGHAVRVMYMCAAMADLAQEYEDKALKEACEAIWKNVVNKRMYITGGIGSSGFRECFTTDYDLPNATNYAETCASIGLMMFGQRMASLTGDASYYDTVERALYNTVLAGINIAGDRYFYVNPLEVVPEFCTQHTYMDHVKPNRQKWFHVACCPPNVARTLASLGQYIYAQDEQTIYIHLFISSQAKISLHENKILVEQQSTLLQDGKVQLRICAEESFEMKVRIPAYARKVEIKEKGMEKSFVQEKGYVLLHMEKGENCIEIDFGVEAEWLMAKDQVRADAGKTVLTKGPLVYCLEEADNGNMLSEIYLEENAQVKEDEPIASLVGEIPTLTYQAIRVSTESNEEAVDLYRKTKLQKKDITVKAIPYFLWNNRGQGEMLVWQKLRV